MRATPAHFFSATPMSFHAGCAGCRQHCGVGIVGGPFWPWLCSFVASPPPKRYAGANARTTGQGRYVPLHRRARTPLSLHFTPLASCARIFMRQLHPRCPRRLRRATPAAPAFHDIATRGFLHRGRGLFRLRRRRCGCPPLVEQSDNFPLGHNVKTEHDEILPEAKKKKVKAATPLLLSVRVPTITMEKKIIILH